MLALLSHTLTVIHNFKKFAPEVILCYSTGYHAIFSMLSQQSSATRCLQAASEQRQQPNFKYDIK